MHNFAYLLRELRELFFSSSSFAGISARIKAKFNKRFNLKTQLLLNFRRIKKK